MKRRSSSGASPIRASAAREHAACGLAGTQASWRDCLLDEYGIEIHPAADADAMLAEAELATLASDIKGRGIQVPVALWLHSLQVTVEDLVLAEEGRAGLLTAVEGQAGRERLVRKQRAISPDGDTASSDDQLKLEV